MRELGLGEKEVLFSVMSEHKQNLKLVVYRQKDYQEDFFLF